MATRWLARSEAMTPAGDDWLSAGELAYVRRQRFTKRRTEFRVARFAAKSALARALGLPADASSLRRIEVGHESSGAPFPRVDGAALDRQVSLTDRAGWAVCLLADAAARIGCDLELVEPRTEAFVADWFTPAELRSVTACADAEHRALAANLIWSAKESALKVLTTGLRRDTRSVEITVDPAGTGWQPLRAATAEGAVFPGWWRRYGSFVLTVVTAGPGPEPALLDAEPLLDAATPVHSWMRAPVVG